MIGREPERIDSIARDRTTITNLKDKIFQHSQPFDFSRHRRIDDDMMHSTVIRIYSGIPFASKYSNACVAARRLAAFLVMPSPLPMATLRTEAVVLTWQVGKVERNLLTGVRPGMYRLAIFSRLLACKAQMLGQICPLFDLL